MVGMPKKIFKFWHENVAILGHSARTFWQILLSIMLTFHDFFILKFPDFSCIFHQIQLFFLTFTDHFEFPVFLWPFLTVGSLWVANPWEVCIERETVIGTPPWLACRRIFLFSVGIWCNFIAFWSESFKPDTFTWYFQNPVDFLAFPCFLHKFSDLLTLS